MKARDLEEISEIIQSFKDADKPWPFIDKNPRRRLTEDNWSREQREMQQEIASFFNDQEVSKPAQSKRLGRKESIRKNQEVLPPVSVNCTNPTFESLPCPDESLPQICDKYNNGNLEECFELCKKSVSSRIYSFLSIYSFSFLLNNTKMPFLSRSQFCCTHDSDASTKGKSCADEDNCKNYIPCYIVWWKLSDTVGPATFFRLPGSRNFLDFFNVDVDFIKAELNIDPAISNFRSDYQFHYTNDDVDLDDKVFALEDNWVRVQNGLRPLTKDDEEFPTN
jgi:hypothetical protein